MQFSIDIGSIQAASGNPILLIWEVFRNGGWVIAAVLYFIGIPIALVKTYISNIQRNYLAKIKYVVLALDIPRLNEQTPKAVEAIFAHLHGVQRSGNLKEKFLQGYIQPQFSFEIIGIEGQTQFIIRTPVDYRDLVEATVFAQYPDAEITEVEDYTEFVPDDFVSAGYEIWGADIVPTNNEVFPIRTYPFFEHSLSQSLLDPMASLLELMGRLGPTEQIWLQMVMTPCDNWLDQAKSAVKKVMGVKELKSVNPFAEIGTQVTKGLFESATYYLLPQSGEPAKPEKPEKPSFMALSTGDKAMIEGIQMKASKIGWKVRFRFLYLGKKPYFSKSRGVTGVMGALKQFSVQDMNGFKPDSTTKTAVDYFFIKSRLLAKQQRILWNYKHRILEKKFMKKNFGRQASQPFIMNVEELASIYHFPVETVKAPMVARTEAKRGEPPIALPIEPYEAEGITASVAGSQAEAPPPRSGPPSNLPV